MLRARGIAVQSLGATLFESGRAVAADVVLRARALGGADARDGAVARVTDAVDAVLSAVRALPASLAGIASQLPMRLSTMPLLPATARPLAAGEVRVVGVTPSTVTVGASGTGTSVLLTATTTATAETPFTATLALAADPTMRATVSGTVRPAGAVSVSVSPATATITGLQQTLRLTATVTGAAGATGTAVRWTSSDLQVADVSADGTVTSRAPGTVAIRATAEADPTRWAQATITVTSGIAITLTPPSASVPLGSTVRLTATLTGTNSTGVVWSSSNAAVASVSARGRRHRARARHDADPRHRRLRPVGVRDGDRDRDAGRRDGRRVADRREPAGGPGAALHGDGHRDDCDGHPVEQQQHGGRLGGRRGHGDGPRDRHGDHHGALDLRPHADGDGHGDRRRVRARRCHAADQRRRAVVALGRRGQPAHVRDHGAHGRHAAGRAHVGRDRRRGPVRAPRAAPAGSTWDCNSTGDANAESCAIANPVAGEWYVTLLGYEAYAGVSLTATVTTGSGGTTPPPSGDGVVLLDQQNLAGSQGSQLVFTVPVPTGYSRLEITLEGSLGDLYVRRGARAEIDPLRPTLVYTADCASFESNYDTERCVFQAPSGTYYITVYGYHAYSGSRVRAVAYR